MRHGAVLLIAVIGLGCSSGTSGQHSNDPALRVVDNYLDNWALLSQLPRPEDVRKLSGEMKRLEPRFLESMVSLLDSGDSRAPARLVYSEVIQVGSVIEVKSALGRAAMKVLGPEFPKRRIDGEELIFAGDLYLWWRRNQSRFAPYSKLRDWETSPFAVKALIPAFERSAAEMALSVRT